MKKEFNRVLKMSVISWIVFIILGILLYTKAELTLKMISYIIGGVLLIIGSIPLLKDLFSKEKTIVDFTLIGEICMIVAGLIIILNTELIASIIPIMVGVLMLINGISKIQFAFHLRASDISSWISTLILGIIVTACGIIFIVNPFRGAVVITKVIGILIIVYTVIDMIDFLIIHKHIKDISETVENIKPTTSIKVIDVEAEEK